MFDQKDYYMHVSSLSHNTQNKLQKRIFILAIAFSPELILQLLTWFYGMITIIVPGYYSQLWVIQCTCSSYRNN